MPSNQNERHRAYQQLAGTNGTYDTDQTAACQNLTGLSGGSANGNLIAALQQAIPSTKTDIGDLKSEAAANAGKTNWEAMDFNDIIALFTP